ncbi:MAG: double zinc ribbon domain-containing protein [Holosporales bacterium]|jgi:ComF family protein|nr:double zinc ribbon domain-containing protein [Holosporales bacterium]
MEFLTDILLGISKVKEILFPPVCAFCGAQTEDYYSLCTNCWFSIKFVNRNVCRYCGIPIKDGATEKYNTTTSSQCCRECSSVGMSVNCDIAASIVYDDFSKKFILRMKERNDPSLALVFAKFFHESDFSGVDFIVPVPIHPGRLWSRTYNQAALLAQGVKFWHPDCPTVELRLLKRHRYTPKQKGKDASARAANVKDCFSVSSQRRELLHGKRVAVLDDVAASGATLIECRKALCEAGAQDVRCIALAKTP